jgi:alpha-tubulin suppressor-like RCC1 family protein
LPTRGQAMAPSRVEGLEDIVSIASALYADQRNVMSAVRRDGAVYVWGAVDIDGGTTKTYLTPIRLALPVGCRAVKLTHGRHHTVMLDDQGRVYTWGLFCVCVLWVCSSLCVCQ